MKIQFTLNGSPVSLDSDPAKPLLDTIRQDLGLTGTKQGCDHEGECGACTVLLNTKPVRSCLTPLGKVQGQEVITIEGMGSKNHPHPLQTTFIEEGAVQCGFCLPGMLLTAKALLDQNPNPSQDEIKETLSGNLCRCTGYQAIIRAVHSAASRIREEKKPGRNSFPDPQSIIGGDWLREDAWEKVSGRVQFVNDLQISNLHPMLVLRSPHHHARLISLDPNKAIQIEGVNCVITAEDIPGENGLGDYSRDEPVLTPIGSTCKMQGAPIALIVADSLPAAKAGLDAIEVEYEILPAVFTIQDALSESAPAIYPNGNKLTSASVSWGNLETAFRDADALLETQYLTSWQEHAALEPERLVGYFDDQNRLTVIGGTHEPHWQQGYIAACLNIPVDEVRVILPPTGGSFGGRQDPWPFLALALGIHFSRHPVKLSYSRLESFQASPKRHPYFMRYRLGAKRDGIITGIQARIQANTGGYDGHGQYLPNFALAGSGGPYRYQAVDSLAESIYTNSPKGGQFRGFGVPQSCFALECSLDEMAQMLDMDPLEFRKLNSIEQTSKTYLGYPLQESLAYQQVLDTIQPHYQDYCQQAAQYNSKRSGDSAVKKGVGLAGMWYRFGKSGELSVEAEAELTPTGELVIYCSAPDYGQGITTALSQMAAETLGIPRRGLRVVNGDTSLTPDSGIQGASRATYFVGGAVVRAARNLKEALLTTASELLDCAPASLVLEDNGIRTSQRKGTSTYVSYLDLVSELQQSRLPTRYKGLFDLSDAFPEETRPEYIPLFVTGAQIADVEVNLKTGQVWVNRITAVHDAGKVINPIDARGQIEGAILMGLGTALMEEYLPEITTGFGGYYLPTALAVPEIETILIEVPSFEGPFGVKGLGEAAILPTAPAIINGISRAIGRRLYHLPATPERVLQAIKGQKATFDDQV